MAMSNQICAYEQCGNVNWIEYLHPAIWNQPMANPDLTGNLAMHLATIQSARYPQHLSGFVSGLLSIQNYPDLSIGKFHTDLSSSPTNPVSLRIAWIGGDFCDHPVGRFLQHYFSASEGYRMHHHSFVSLVNHGKLSTLSSFSDYHNTHVLDASIIQKSCLVEEIRMQNFDVVIDLSGWTGGHYAQGFLARYAPIQINYLGYFASSGLPSMDYWLGDHYLFPDHMQEWHTERLWRLERPFIAWQPPKHLPEGNIDVPESSFCRHFCFGSFNHNRKLSDITLSVWGRIMSQLPDARLVLKANSSDDSGTQRLLSQRMLKNGLNPEQVIWLPLASTSREHLLQYAHIDLALDPFPNGGCTTTLEAFWMGCPVLTLAGTHYVSRMSHSIVSSIGLHDLTAQTFEEYIAMALDYSARKSQLRASRSQWRDLLASNQIGDARHLFSQLESSFFSMVMPK
jgi:predicted O-linked N-acetylglucosamine transferase (SPINDLY family)